MKPWMGMSMPLSSMGLREYRWFWTTLIFCSLKQTTGRTATNGLSRSISRTVSPFLMHTRFRRAVVILIKLLLNRGYIGAFSSSDPYTLLLTFHKQKKYLVLALLLKINYIVSEFLIVGTCAFTCLLIIKIGLK